MTLLPELLRSLVVAAAADVDNDKDDNTDNDDDDVVNCVQESTVDIWLKLIDSRIQLYLQVTSGNVTLTSDPLLTTSDLVNTDDDDDDDDASCLFYVDVKVDRNHVTFTGSVLLLLLAKTTTTAAAAFSICSTCLFSTVAHNKLGLKRDL